MSHGIEVTHESIKESLHHIPPGKVGPLVVPSQVNTAATAAAANDDIPCFFIPSELFLQASSLDDLRQNFRSEFRGYSDRSRRRVFASHRWLTYQHPDPQNVQFRSLQALFASNDAEKFLVLYDYLSFPSDVPIVDIVRKLDSITLPRSFDFAPRARVNSPFCHSPCVASPCICVTRCWRATTASCAKSLALPDS